MRRAKAEGRRQKVESGFTLIELLTVITIIGILAALIVGASKYALQKSKRSSVVARIATLETKLEDYRADNGIYPQQPAIPGPGSTVILYKALAGVPVGKKYFTAFTPAETNVTEVIDPFGNEYLYQCPGTHNPSTYDLWSLGPDGKNDVGTNDDITNWQSN